MAQYKKEPVKNSDKVILMGDLNFRNELKYEDALLHISKIKSAES